VILDNEENGKAVVLGGLLAYSVDTRVSQRGFFFFDVGFLILVGQAQLGFFF
jgi:hypothetical protein